MTIGHLKRKRSEEANSVRVELKKKKRRKSQWRVRNKRTRELRRMKRREKKRRKNAFGSCTSKLLVLCCLVRVLK